MKKVIDLFNFLSLGAFLTAVILFIGDLFGFSLGINFQLLWRVLAGFLALTVLLNTGNIKKIIKVSNFSRKFLLLSGLNLFLFALFLLFYPIFRFGSPFVWEDRIPNFKAVKKIEIALNESLKQTFQAKSNNLGTIGLRIISEDIVIEEEGEEEEEATISAELIENEETAIVQGINTEEEGLGEELDGKVDFSEPERIVFRIKEEKSSDYFYENTYELNQYWQTNYFLFGFPIQHESEGKNYVLEIDKTKEGETDKVFLIEENSQGKFNFYPRYVYNLASLKTDWEPILLNISRKTTQFLEERNSQINLIFAFLLIEFLIFIFLRKEQEQFKEKLNFYLKYGFLIGLLLIAISSLNFEFIKNTDYLQNVINNLSKYSLPLVLLTILTITLRFLLFYFNGERVEKETGKEEKAERLLEEKRLQEFSQKFPRLFKVPIFGNIVRWIYKEGWGYSIGLIVIILIGFGLGVRNYNVLQTCDFYNLISAKALVQNGFTNYTRNLDYSYLISFLFDLFSPSLFWARILPILFNTINIAFIYFLGKYIVSKKIGIISAILLCVSPWAIGIALSIREYSFNMMIATIIYYLIFKLYKNSKKILSYKFLISFLTILILLFSYSYFFKNYTMLIVIFTLLIIFYCFLITELLTKKMGRKYILASLVLILLGVLAILNVNKFYNIFFLEKFTFQIDWFKIYFDPTIKYPMQWFASESPIFLLIIFIFLLGLFSKNVFLKIVTSGFLFTLLFLSVKFDFINNIIVPRYVFHLFPLYIITFSFGLYVFLSAIKKLFIQSNKILINAAVILILFIFVNPYNTFFAVFLNHQKYDKSLKRITYTPFDNRYYEVFANMKEAGVKKNDPIVVENINNLVIWFLDYDIDSVKNMVRPDGNKYDNGINMYTENKGIKVFQINEAIQNHDQGWMILETEKLPFYSPRFENDDLYYIETKIPPNKIIKQIESFKKDENLGFKLYKWETLK